VVEGDQVGVLRFVNHQLELMRSQARAIEAGDYSLAIRTGVQLAAAGDEWRQLIRMVNHGGFAPETATQIRHAVAEMTVIHERMLHLLEPAQSKLAERLQDVRQGRQALLTYRSGKRKPKRILDTHA